MKLTQSLLLTSFAILMSCCSVNEKMQSQALISNGEEVKCCSPLKVLRLVSSGKECTLSLVGGNFGITAAHCKSEDLSLYDEKGRLFEYKIKKFEIHPLWNEEVQKGNLLNRFDVGIIHFDRDFETGYPTPLNNEEPKVFDMVKLMGFGSDNAEASSSPTLRSGHNVIKSKYLGLFVLDGLIKGNPQTSKGADAASTRGDSGGSVFKEDQLVGVVSGGNIQGGRKITYFVNILSDELKPFLKPIWSKDR